MQSPNILPATCPDQLLDVADGATFYFDPDRKPAYQGQAFIKVYSSLASSCYAIRLSDGHLMSLLPDEPVRVVELTAEVSGEDW